MLQIKYVLPSAMAAQSLLPENPPEQPRRRRLRLYLVGSKEDTQRAIDHLPVGLRRTHRVEPSHRDSRKWSGDSA